MKLRISKNRIIKNHIFTVLCYLTSFVSLAFLIAILWSLIKHGIPHLHWQTFTDTTPAPGMPGGLSNAILGSVMMTGLSIIIAAPIGVLIATFMVDFYGKKRLAKFIRFANDVMLSAPSIVIGLFVYAIFVRPLGHFSGFSGSVALAIIALPMIVRTTEDVLYLVSPTLKEAAVALGIPRWRVTVSIVYRAARSGIITAVLLATARIAGETAPLLFTALNNQFSSVDMTQPIANLPVVIFQYAMSPYQGWQDLAWAGALLITLTILIINVIARVITHNKHDTR